MKHIAIFIKKTTFHKNYGGMETQSKVLAEELVKRGYAVDVFAPNWEIAENSKSLNGVSYHFVQGDYRYFLSKIRPSSWYRKSLLAFDRVHAAKPFDLVISQSSAGLAIIDNKSFFNVKAISIAHGSAMGELRTFVINHHGIKDMPRVVLNLQYALRQFFNRQRQFVLGSNKVIAVSNAVRRQLIDETFVPDAKIEVINNGIFPFEMKTTTQSAGKFLYVGQLTEDKGVSLFIKLAQDNRFKKFDLTIIGDGPLYSELKAFEQSGTGLKLHVLGKLEHEKILNFLSDAYGMVFLFPTRRVEGFPMVLAEAMMAGLPIIGYDLGGVSDAISDNFNGYLIKFGYETVFTAKTLDLAENTAKIRDMSLNSRAKALAQFTTDIMLDKYEKVFREVLGQ